MYFKRPLFKRGGPTGIAQLTPRRQGYAGGGNIGGSRIGLFEGGIPTSMMEELTGGANKIKTTSSNPYRISGYPKKGFNMLQGPTRSTLQRLYSNPYVRGGVYGAAAGVGTGIGLLADAYQKATKTPLAYKKLKEVSSRPYYFDETNIDVGEGLDEIRTANEIGVAPGFFPRGGKDKFYEDRNLDPKTGLAIEDININMRGDPAQFSGEDEVTDFEALRQAEIETNKAAEKANRIELGSDDNSITLDPYEEIKKEKDFLSEMLQNEGLERGEIALIAAKAIGTEGSFKDKLDAAVDLALPVVRARNKEDKALTLTAYKLFKEKEAAQTKLQATLGKDTPQLKNINAMAQAIKNQGDKRNISAIRDELIVKQSGMDSDTKKIMLESTPNVINLVQDINKQRKLLAVENAKKKPKEKNIEKITEKITVYEDELKQLQSIGGNSFDSLFGDLTKGYFAEGGRVKRQLGSPETGEQIVKTEDTIVSMPGGSVPEKPVLNLSYEELRNRLPRSITDDIINLLANSEEALQEFAYITSQDDVNSFNVKYGVNLIIPPTTE